MCIRDRFSIIGILSLIFEPPSIAVEFDDLALMHSVIFIISFSRSIPPNDGSLFVIPVMDEWLRWIVPNPSFINTSENEERKSIKSGLLFSSPSLNLTLSNKNKVPLGWESKIVEILDWFLCSIKKISLFILLLISWIRGLKE